MQNTDITPLFRNGIGFDRLFRMMEANMHADRDKTGAPPCDIVSIADDHYRLTMAVPGYDDGDLDVTIQDQVLTISGGRKERSDEPHYLYRGIADQAFLRRFNLADHVEVVDAHLENGMLTIDLERRVPDAMKPRSIRISKGAPESLLSKTRRLLEGRIRRKAA